MHRRKFLKTAVICGAAAGAWKTAPAQMGRQPATGPLHVHPQNPRYFADASGRAIFLTGAHTWANLQDTGVAPIPTFDWQAYLAMMLSHNHNFMRLWGWQQSAWAPWTPDKILFEPVLYISTACARLRVPRSRHLLRGAAFPGVQLQPAASLRKADLVRPSPQRAKQHQRGSTATGMAMGSRTSTIRKCASSTRLI